MNLLTMLWISHWPLDAKGSYLILDPVLSLNMIPYSNDFILSLFFFLTFFVFMWCVDAFSAALQSPREAPAAEVVPANAWAREEEDHTGHDHLGTGSKTTHM